MGIVCEALPSEDSSSPLLMGFYEVTRCGDSSITVKPLGIEKTVIPGIGNGGPNVRCRATAPVADDRKRVCKLDKEGRGRIRLRGPGSTSLVLVPLPVGQRHVVGRCQQNLAVTDTENLGVFRGDNLWSMYSYSM